MELTFWYHTPHLSLPSSNPWILALFPDYFFSKILIEIKCLQKPFKTNIPEIERITLQCSILAVTGQAKLKATVRRGLKNNIHYLGWTLLV